MLSRYGKERRGARYERWASIACLAMFGVLLIEVLYFL